MVRRLRLPAVLVLAATAVLATGCGHHGDTGGPVVATTPTHSVSPTLTSSPDPLPRCGAVWVVGRQLTDGYNGCTAGGQTFAKRLRCENGQQIFSYRAHYFAVPGGRIFVASGTLAQDPEYRLMHRACTA